MSHRGQRNRAIKESFWDSTTEAYFQARLLGISSPESEPEEDSKRAVVDSIVKAMRTSLRTPDIRALERSLFTDYPYAFPFEGVLVPVRDERGRAVGWNYVETNPADPDHPRCVEDVLGTIPSYRRQRAFLR